MSIQIVIKRGAYIKHRRNELGKSVSESGRDLCGQIIGDEHFKHISNTSLQSSDTDSRIRDQQTVGKSGNDHLNVDDGLIRDERGQSANDAEGGFPVRMAR